MNKSANAKKTSDKARRKRLRLLWKKAGEGCASKACTDCGEIQPLIGFDKDHSDESGHMSICRSCRSIRLRRFRVLNGELTPKEKENDQRLRLERKNRDRLSKDYYVKRVLGVSDQTPAIADLIGAKRIQLQILRSIKNEKRI